MVRSVLRTAEPPEQLHQRQAVSFCPQQRVGDVVARLDPEDLRLQVQSAEAELAAATSNLAQASADFERYSKLKTNGWASIADFDRKKAANDEAQGRLDRARRALDLARNQLGYADLKADADGLITATLAEPGQVKNHPCDASATTCWTISAFDCSPALRTAPLATRCRRCRATRFRSKPTWAGP